MSTKFEQLLDLIVNEESEKASELFHAIVVEKSREIYENLIAEEEDEEEMDEASDEDDESVDESADDEEEMDESVDLEDSYSMESDDGFGGGAEGDATDDFGAEIGADDEEGDDEMGDEEGGEGQEDQAIFDIKNAIAELEAAFAELEQAQGGETGSDFGDEEGDEFGGDEEGGDEMMGQPAFEGRRVTREYVEKVGNDWEKSGSQKSQGVYVGSGSGDKEGAPQEGRSPVSSGKGKPTTGATAANILKPGTEGGTNTGTSPAGKAGGFLSAAKDMNTGNQNVPGGKVSVKGLSKVAGGHGAEKKGAGPGPVGSGSGDKAGQTSVAKVPQFLKPLR
jgi:hypothetical protein